ncbi:MAG: hypothetical protein PW843_08275 [Azospirillaceae bacterium]|nr:hypothetical protein [Azospirillaceae bacterium]
MTRHTAHRAGFTYSAPGVPGWAWVASAGAVRRGMALGALRLPARADGALRRVVPGDRVLCFTPEEGDGRFVALGYALPGGILVDTDELERVWSCLPVAYVPVLPVSLAAVMDGALAAMGWGLSLPVGLLRLDGGTLDAIAALMAPPVAAMVSAPGRVASLEGAD